jgi:radical SAM protein with 4Fe4S-binding SPASM domain
MEQDARLYLSDRFALVTGARYAIIADFETGSFRRPNEAARKIIELGEQGLTVGEIVAALQSEFDTSDVLPFIQALCAEGLMTLARGPRPTPAGEVSAPQLDLLWIEVTGRCNLRCIHCYAEADNHREKGIPAALLVKALDDAAAMGCRKVQFTGGECTSRRELPDLIRHAKSRDFEMVEVFTNGTLLDERTVEFFARTGVAVALTLHSCRQETHDEITGVPGSFDRTIRGLEYLLAYKVPVRCNTIAMKENEQDILETMYFLSKLGVLTGPADPIRPTGRGMGRDRWPEQYGRLLTRTKPRFVVDRSCYEQNRRWNSCWRGKAAVTSRGDIIPCVFARDQVAGNIAEAGLREIIAGAAMRKYWSLTYDQVKDCRDCEYRYFCRDCRPWPHGATGDLYAKSPRCAYDPYSGEWAGSETLAGATEQLA